MKKLIKLILIIEALQLQYSAFTQVVSNKSVRIFTFNTVYSSNLVDFSSLTTDDLYLVVSDKPVKFDSVTFALSKKKYSSVSGILDTLRKRFKVYNIIKTDSKNKSRDRDSINKNLIDYNNYRTGYLFSLDPVKNNGPEVAYVMRQYSLEARIKYKVLSENCSDFPDECKAIIISLK